MRERIESIFRRALGRSGSRPSLADGVSGQIITAAVVALLIIAIFIPLIVRYVDQESRWAIKTKQTTTAFHLAEGAVDRGLWKLTEEDTIWTNAKTGVTVAGYADDVVYTDVSGGEYKIKFSSGPSTGQVTVRGKGRDTSTNEMRVIEAVYDKASISAGLSVDGALTYRPNLHVHWGPVVDYSSIDQSPSDYYPRKYSKGQITGRDTVNDSNNTDGVEYWAFNPDLGTAPQIDLAYYKTQAQASRIPLTTSSPSGGIYKNSGGTPTAVSSPTGSGYFPVSLNSGGIIMKKIGGSGNYYYFNNSTSTIYIDNDTAGNATTDLQNGGVYLHVEALIAAGSNHGLDINADVGVVQATIPAAAQTEYLSTSGGTAYWTANFAAPFANANHCCYSLSHLAAWGLVYVGGNVANAGANTEILGVFDVHGNVSVNTVKVYYDPDVAANIHLVAGSPTRRSWKEVKTSW